MVNPRIGLCRLYHQRITHPPFADAAAVVAWLGVMQGQDYVGSKWAFGLRLPGSTEAAVEQAVAAGTIMRTWALRGTLHFVAPADIHWILGLVGPRQIAGNKGRYQQLELDEPTLIRSTDLIVNALRDGQHLSRPELFTLLEAAGISTAGQRGVYMLQRACLERLIYQGEMQGKDTTFHILKPGRILPREEAVAQLAGRYFTSHGPATLADFVNWSGLPITGARDGLASVKAQLMEEVIDGQSYWMPLARPQPPEHTVYLLPGFDEYILGYKDRTTVVDPPFLNAICPGSNGMFIPTIVSGGEVVGTWRRTVKKRTVDFELQPFRPLTGDEWSAVVAAAGRYGAYVEREAVVQPLT